MEKRPQRRPFPCGCVIVICLFAFLLGAGLALWRRPAVANSAPGNPAPQANSGGLLSSLFGPKVPKWTRTEPLTVLLLGTDKRPQEPGPSRSDTMMLAMFDPARKHVSLLSIPRDLWVNVPGYGENRINTAYFEGQAYGLANGGPGLAALTVEYNFGVPIDYWVTVDFQGFVQIINALGGIDVNVPNEIVDYEYPDSNYGTFVLTIPAGQQHMDGERALQYARTRHSTSDFDRARRQQQIILAVRDRVLSPQVLPKLPRLIQACSGAVSTNADSQMVLSLASLAPQLQDVTVDNRVIDENMAPNYVTADGAQVLMPDWQAIRPMVQEMFAARLPQGQPLANTGLRIENATDLAGLAGMTAQFLQSAGATIVSYGDRQGGALQRSQLYVYADAPQAVAYLRSIYHLQDDQVQRAEGGPPGVALNLVLGWDAIAGE